MWVSARSLTQGVAITDMQAVKSQVATNEAAAASFFARVQAVVAQHVEAQKKEAQTQEAVEHLLLLAPLLQIVKKHVGKRRIGDVGRGGLPEATRRHHFRRKDRFHILLLLPRVS